MTITIQGFTAKQHIIADLIWGMDSEADVLNFIQSLPDEDAREAMVVRDMIIAAALDQITDTALAKNVLDRFTL